MVSLIILILILGIIILVHELGHFFWAKKFGVHIYEFSIGMGPVIYSKMGKDKIKYNVRAVPIGGFVSMAGEVYEDADDEEKIPKEKYMCNKKWHQRVIILVAGVVNNFIMAFVILFFISLIWGGTLLTPKIDSVVEGSAMEDAGVVAGGTIKEINGYDISSWDVAQIVLHMEDKDGVYEFVIENEDGKTKTYDVEPKVEKNDDGVETKTFGVGIKVEETSGFLGSLEYAFVKFGSIVEVMILTIASLFTGSISLSALSGPIGMYEVVDASAALGFASLVSLTAFLSINVGFLNILPFPAFDGGRIVFLIIEKIKGSPINSKIENIFHLVGFALLMLLTIYVAVQDIIRLF